MNEKKEKFKFNNIHIKSNEHLENIGLPLSSSKNQGKIIFRNLDQERLKHKVSRSNSPNVNNHYSPYIKQKLQKCVQINDQKLKVALAEAEWNKVKRKILTPINKSNYEVVKRDVSKNFLFPTKHKNDENYQVEIIRFDKCNSEYVKIALATKQILNRYRSKSATKNITKVNNIDTKYKPKKNSHPKKSYHNSEMDLKTKNNILANIIQNINKCELSLISVNENYMEDGISCPKISKAPKFIDGNLMIK